jgi:hypothetical protein
VNDLVRLSAGRVVPTSFTVLYDRLEQLFGSQLQLQDVDEDWMTFRVEGMTDYILFFALQNAQETLFPEGTSAWQILCPAYGSTVKGVSIQELTGRKLDECLSGYCYY